MAPLLSLQDVAQTLSVSEPTVKRLIITGQLSAIRVGRQFRFKPDALEQFLAQ